MSNYFSASVILDKAKDKVIPLPTQKSAVENIANLISLHLRRLNAIHSGIEMEYIPRISQLLIAPTGSGKTYLISQMAKVCGLPFFTIDASELTFSGFKGVNLSENFTQLKESFDGPGIFEEGIFLIDEVDKVAIRNPDEERGNVQPNFLKMLENGSITLKSDSCRKPEALDTSRMLFVFSGAFSGLETIIQNRLKPEKRIGFYADTKTLHSEKEILLQATLKDVEKYGFMPELLGRIGSLYVMSELKKEDYRQLVTEGKTSEQQKFNRMFQQSGVQFQITSSAADYIANLGTEKHLGARFITPMLLEELQPAFWEVDQNSAINQVILTRDETSKQFQLQYKSGERAFYSEANEPLPVEPCPDFSELKPDMFLALSIEDFFESNRELQLMQILSNHALEYDHMKQEEIFFFETFLKLFLYFLKHHTNSADQTLHSVQKLSQCCFKNGNDETTLEIMVYDSEYKMQFSRPALSGITYLAEYKHIHSDYRASRVCQIIEDTYRSMDCMMQSTPEKRGV